MIGLNVCLYNHSVNLNNHVLVLKDMLNNKIKRGYKDLETIFHSDQGSIYTSISFNDFYVNHNIIRSISFAGTPTDNRAIKSKNGWLKAEMKLDFNKDDFNTVDEYINFIIYDYNYLRPAYKPKYKTLVQFRSEQGFI